MLNTISIAGRMTRDPEVRTTQAGKTVANFTLACERDLKGADGNRETDFVDVVAWGGTAEFVEKYSGKGLLLAVKGRLQIRKYKDNNGNNRTAAEVVADNVYPMEWRKGDAYEEPAAKEEVPDLGDDDLPF